MDALHTVSDPLTVKKINHHNDAVLGIETVEERPLENNHLSSLQRSSSDIDDQDPDFDGTNTSITDPESLSYQAPDSEDDSNDDDVSE